MRGPAPRTLVVAAEHGSAALETDPPELHPLQAVQSVAPLKGQPLYHLNIKGCKSIRDLSPLKGMRIKELRTEGSGVGKAR